MGYLHLPILYLPNSTNRSGNQKLSAEQNTGRRADIIYVIRLLETSTSRSLPHHRLLLSKEFQTSQVSG